MVYIGLIDLLKWMCCLLAGYSFYIADYHMVYILLGDAVACEIWRVQTKQRLEDEV